MSNALGPALLRESSTVVGIVTGRRPVARAPIPSRGMSRHEYAARNRPRDALRLQDRPEGGRGTSCRPGGAPSAAGDEGRAGLRRAGQKRA
jgi:hypothetical protein